MVWRRLNDHGKNWRHVYKSLVVLEYLVKNGSERVVRQCQDNLFSIQTLKDFQFLDKDGKDQGSNGEGGGKALQGMFQTIAMAPHSPTNRVIGLTLRMQSAHAHVYLHVVCHVCMRVCLHLQCVRRQSSL